MSDKRSSGLKYETLAQDVISDLNALGQSNSLPNEIMPKEEQIRSRIYASLLCDKDLDLTALEKVLVGKRLEQQTRRAEEAMEIG